MAEGAGVRLGRPSPLSWRSLTARLVLATMVWIVVLLAAGGSLITRVFEDNIVRTFDARLSQYLEGMIGASELDGEGEVRFTRALGDQRFFEPYSGWYWQVETLGKPAFRSRSLWDQTLNAELGEPAFVSRISRISGPDGQTLRMLERDVYLPDSDAVYRYRVAGDVSEIDAQVARFRLTLGWGLFGLGAGLIAALLIQVWYGLRPLRTLRGELVAIRAGTKSRLSGPFPLEVAPLVDELNALLDHNVDLVERARTHAGNLAHALKTPLSVLVAEAENAEGPLAQSVHRQADEIRRHIDYHLVRARAAASGQVIGARTPVGPVAERLLRALGRIHADRGLYFTLEGDGALAFRGARQDLEEMLGNLADNAAKWAKRRVRLGLSRTPPGQAPARLRVEIEDDGPGVEDADLPRLFERGRRGDENVPGSGLGLSIVRDVAALCGGVVELGRSPTLGGFRAVLDLPLADA